MGPAPQDQPQSGPAHGTSPMKPVPVRTSPRRPAPVRTSPWDFFFFCLRSHQRPYSKHFLLALIQGPAPKGSQDQHLRGPRIGPMGPAPQDQPQSGPAPVKTSPSQDRTPCARALVPISHLRGTYMT